MFRRDRTSSSPTRAGEDSRAEFKELRFGERGGEGKPGEPKVA